MVFLPEVFFEFDSNILTQSANKKLSIMSGVLNDPKTSMRRILVVGHTDSIGDSEYNEALSLRRANAVADQLTAKGISNDRMVRRGYGKKYPIAPNMTPEGLDNPEGRAKNRRVEIVLENPIEL